MAYFPPANRLVMLDEDDGDEALVDSRFDAGSSEVSLYSDAHNLRVWSSTSNDARVVLPASTANSIPAIPKNRAIDGKRDRSSVSRINWMLTSGLAALLPDMASVKNTPRSKSRPREHHDDPVQAEEQPHQRSWETSQPIHFEDLVADVIENQEMNVNATGGNDTHEVHGEGQAATRQESCKLPLDLNEPSTVDETLSTPCSGMLIEGPAKETGHSSVKELSTRSRTGPQLPAFVFDVYPLMQALHINSPMQHRREIVIELVHRVLSCCPLTKYLLWLKNHHETNATYPRPIGPFQCDTSQGQSRSSTPLLGVENAWETELREALVLFVPRSNESASSVGNGSSKEATTPTASHEASSSTTSSAQSTPSKRPRQRSGRGKSNRGDDDNPSDNEEEDHPSKKARSLAEPSSPAEKLLACPYWKYDPTRYSPANTSEKKYRGCSSVYLRDIARLKQHLYRVHKMPDYHCQRCLEVFEDEPSLEEHVRAPATKACAYRENSSSELLSERQCAQLRKRWTGKTTEEAWKCIWSIIFPRLEPPLSIYAEEAPAFVQPAQMAGFLNEFQRLAPSMLHQILVERSSDTLSTEISSWLQSADAQSILGASIQELCNRLSNSENNQPAQETTPVATTSYFVPEFPEFSDLFNFDIFDEAFMDPNPVTSEESSGESDGALKEKPESTESVLNRTHPVNEFAFLPKISEPTVKSQTQVKGQTPSKIPEPIRSNRSPPRNEKGQLFCDHISCRHKSDQTFKRVCEWNKHMDQHEKPYKCQEPGCEANPGFTYSGGLLRHMREIHKMYQFSSTGRPLFCSFPNCNRSSGSGFTRKENLEEHIRRRHSGESPNHGSGEATVTSVVRHVDGPNGTENTCDPRQLFTNTPVGPLPEVHRDAAGLEVPQRESQGPPVWHPR